MPSRPIRIRKHDLAIILQQIQPHPKPKAALEQYTTPADLAAEILFTACYANDDIQNKRVLDLGAGTGRLAIGAALLGAAYVVGIDIEPESLRLASIAKRQFHTQVDLVLGPIEAIGRPVDTVLMNPPFGTKKAHADLHFLERAIELGAVVYSIHKSATRSFLKDWFRKRELGYERILATRIEIPHQFTFHRKPKRFVEVDVIRVTK